MVMNSHAINILWFIFMCPFYHSQCESGTPSKLEVIPSLTLVILFASAYTIVNGHGLHIDNCMEGKTIYMSRISRDEIVLGQLVNGYDYENQAWVEKCRYVKCGHPESMECNCYGRIHEGERCNAQVEVTS